jgi:CheY-like chemotaxis protein
MIMRDYILVVDDDPEVRSLVVNMLKMMGMEGRKAVNGEHALKLIDEHPPKAIVLDLIMPVMDGFLTLSKLQTNQRSRHIPIILMSALTGNEHHVKKLPGVIGVMPKSQFSIDEFQLLLAQAGISGRR